MRFHCVLALAKLRRAGRCGKVCPWPGKRTPSPTELRCRDEAGVATGGRIPGAPDARSLPSVPAWTARVSAEGPGRGSPGPGLGHPSEPRAWRARPVEAPQGLARGLRGHIAGPGDWPNGGARVPRDAWAARGLPGPSGGEGKRRGVPFKRPPRTGLGGADELGGGRGAAPFDQSKLNRRAK